MINKEYYHSLISELNEKNCSLLAVSKTKPIEDIRALYDEGQRLFGENKVQEILLKRPQLPADIEWHLIGSLQTNKVKQIINQVHLIHSLDSIRLWEELNNESEKQGIIINVLIQIKVAKEYTKSGFDLKALYDFLTTGKHKEYKNVKLCGVMGMASFVEDEKTIRTEFKVLTNQFNQLKSIYFNHPEFRIISMGMSSDYKIAIEEGSNLVRIGSSLFGERG